MLMVGRGTLAMTDDGSGQQRMQVTLLDGETRDAADRVQQYGISAHPPAGSQVVVINVGGQRDHPIIIGVDAAGDRPVGLAPGEVMIWSVHGQRVHLRGDGGLAITTKHGHQVEMSPDGGMLFKAPGPIRMETPRLEVTGDIIDSAAAGGVSMAAMRGAYNAHGHPGYTGTPPNPPMAAPAP